jgi:general secretion pathway protein F
VLALAYTLFVLLVHNGLPHLAAAFDSLGLVTSSPLRRLIELGELAPYWWPIGPVLLLVLAFLWNRSGRAAQFQSGAWTGLRIFPWMRSTLADYETSNFAGLLGLLLEHKVPYPSALVLAAEATGEKKLIRGAAQMAAAIELGAPPTGALEGVDPESFQPMLRWTLATGQDQGSLAGSLQSLSEMYKKRATYRAEKMYVFLPLILMIGIGGAATLLYGLALFIPLVNLLYELGAA